MCIDCPDQKNCLFFTSFADTKSEAVKKLMHTYAQTGEAWKDCIRLYIQKRHGIVLPYDFGPHGKSVEQRISAGKPLFSRGLP